MSGVDRPSLMESYVNSVTLYLAKLWPDIPIEKIKEIVKTQVASSIKRPYAEVVTYPEYGNQELKKVDLLNMIRKTKNKTIAPGGTIFQTTDVHVPLVKQFLDALVERRDNAKKAMFEYIKQNRKLEADNKNSEQALNKIAANSVSGGCGTDVNALYDKESYCSITSMCRHGTMMAYTFAERFLSSNYYFPTYEDAINFLITTLEKCPPKEEIRDVLNRYHLTEVFFDHLYDLVHSGLDRYAAKDTHKDFILERLIKNMSPEERSFIYYSRSLYNIMYLNPDVTHEFFTELFTLDTNEKCLKREDVDISILKKLDGDLEQALQTSYAKILGEEVIKKLPDTNKELALKMAKIAYTAQEKINYIQPLIDMFLHSKVMIPKAHINKDMIRKAIIVSDTDSIIYTSKDIVTLYLKGTFTYSNPYVYSMHAFATYFLCKSVSSLLRMIAIQRGAIGEKNIKMLKMKNEFLYPVFIRTNQSKHYIGYLTVQEGIVLKDPKMDVKGVQYKSSNLPKVTHKFTSKVIDTLVEDINTHTNIYAGDYISMVLNYEQQIFKSLREGQLTYYTNAPVKMKEEYKTPDSSLYSNYLIWQEVFSKKYGDIFVPSKCYLIPFTKNKYKSPEYLNWLMEKYPDIYKKWDIYIKKNPTKKINRLPIPIACQQIPEELIPLVDMRSIVFKNVQPAMLLLKTAGIDLGNPKKLMLLSDYYTLSIEG